MKKIIVSMLLFVTFLSFSQAPLKLSDFGLQSVSTTEKEYNYLTKGLKIQMESGLDVIDGYVLNQFKNEKSVILILIFNT